MDEALKSVVRQPAAFRCEYCLLPERCSSIPFEIDHVVSLQHGGNTVPGNLALACFADNRHKGPNPVGIDPKTGNRVFLFNPRRHKWVCHFRYDGPFLVGRTAVGRATIAVLQINALHRVAQRAALIAEGVFQTK